MPIALEQYLENHTEISKIELCLDNDVTGIGASFTLMQKLMSMGHRDTDFSILQYVKLGDKLTVKIQENTYTYTVNDIQIIDSDDGLKFSAVSSSNLVLVTCYPFRYSGHAPKKCVIYAELS